MHSLFRSLLLSASSCAVFATSMAQAPQTSTPIPYQFFGMHVLNFAPLTSQLPKHGTIRSLDAYPNISWNEINTAKDVYTWSSLDQFVAAAQSTSTDIIYTFNNTPQWASATPNQLCPNEPAGSCSTPTEAAWDAFVWSIATRYKGQIKYYEIWDEPALSKYYSGTVASMIVLARDAYSIIHQIDPQAQILSPSGTTSSGPPWLANYFAAGGGAYTDIVAYHGYSYGTAPLTAESEIANVIAPYVKVTTLYGQQNKPLWDDEFSWVNSTEQSTPAAQAAFLAKRFILGWTNGINRVVWYAYDGGYWGGLWTSDGGTNPAGLAYSTIFNWLCSAYLTGCSVDGNGTYTCTLSRPQYNFTALIVWNSTKSINYPVGPAYFQFHDLSGNTTPVTNGLVVAADSPILIDHN